MTEDGQSLFDQQTAIAAGETAISDKQYQASDLQGELEQLPELVEVEQDQADEELMIHLAADHSDLYYQVVTGQAIIIVNEAGKLEILVRQYIHEESKEMPEVIRDIMTALQKHNQLGLPDELAAKLGLPVAEPKPELTAPEAVKDQVPDGTFMAEGDGPGNLPPLDAITVTPPVTEPDNGYEPAVDEPTSEPSAQTGHDAIPPGTFNESATYGPGNLPPLDAIPAELEAPAFDSCFVGHRHPHEQVTTDEETAHNSDGEDTEVPVITPIASDAPRAGKSAGVGANAPPDHQDGGRQGD